MRYTVVALALVLSACQLPPIKYIPSPCRQGKYEGMPEIPCNREYIQGCQIQWCLAEEEETWPHS